MLHLPFEIKSPSLGKDSIKCRKGAQNNSLVRNSESKKVGRARDLRYSSQNVKTNLMAWNFKRTRTICSEYPEIFRYEKAVCDRLFSILLSPPYPLPFVSPLAYNSEKRLPLVFYSSGIEGDQGTGSKSLTKDQVPRWFRYGIVGGVGDA